MQIKPPGFYLYVNSFILLKFLDGEVIWRCAVKANAHSSKFNTVHRWTAASEGKHSQILTFWWKENLQKCWPTLATWFQISPTRRAVGPQAVQWTKLWAATTQRASRWSLMDRRTSDPEAFSRSLGRRNKKKTNKKKNRNKNKTLLGWRSPQCNVLKREKLKETLFLLFSWQPCFPRLELIYTKWLQTAFKEEIKAQIHWVFIVCHEIRSQVCCTGVTCGLLINVMGFKRSIAGLNSSLTPELCWNEQENQTSVLQTAGFITVVFHRLV